MKSALRTAPFFNKRLNSMTIGSIYDIVVLGFLFCDLLLLIYGLLQSLSPFYFSYQRKATWELLGNLGGHLSKVSRYLVVYSDISRHPIRTTSVPNSSPKGTRKDTNARYNAKYRRRGLALTETKQIKRGGGGWWDKYGTH